MDNEIWKETLGYEGMYAISNYGRLKGIKRTIKASNQFVDFDRTINEKIYKPSINGSGYFTVALSKNGTSKTYLLHRLVAETFIKNEKNKKEVNHKDGNKINNAVSNLEWLSSKENKTHAKKKGLGYLGGERCVQSILKNDDINGIRLLLKCGLSQSKIGNLYGVSQGAIQKINKNKTWSHVKFSLEMTQQYLSALQAKPPGLQPKDLLKFFPGSLSNCQPSLKQDQ